MPSPYRTPTGEKIALREYPSAGRDDQAPWWARLVAERKRAGRASHGWERLVLWVQHLNLRRAS